MNVFSDEYRAAVRRPATPDKLTFRVTLEVSVSPEQWTTAYGVEGLDAIQADVIESLTAQGPLGASDAPITVRKVR